VTVLRIGTRASALATAQSANIARQLRDRTGQETELVEISTEGDRSTRLLTELGGQGVFVSALRDALVAGRIDVAVHSLKDLPTTPDPAVSLAAIPAREDPRDVVVARDGLTLAGLPHGATVATGSPRRAAQINALGLGVEVVPIRGNVDTRMNRVREGIVDAVVLARAGLVRLGRLDEATEVLDPLQMLPAPGQGALACECRADDVTVEHLLHDALEDAASRLVVSAERSLLATLEAGCSAPVGALGDLALGDDGDELWLRAFVGDISGAPTIKMSTTGSPDDAVATGARLAVEMLAEGASSLMKEAVS